MIEKCIPWNEVFNFFQKLKENIETSFSFKRNVQDVIVYTWWITLDIHDKIDYLTCSVKTSFSIRAEFYQTRQVLIRCTQIPRLSSAIFSFWCFLKLSCVPWTFVYRSHGKSVMRNLKFKDKILIRNEKSVTEH